MRYHQDNNFSNRDLWMIFLSLAFISFVTQLWIRDLRKDEYQIQHKVNLEDLEDGEMKRVNVSFIMGQDKSEENKYYENAELYFRFSPEERTDEVITDCTSLACVFRNLSEIYNRTKRKFGRVNIVSHSNPWTGVSISVYDEGDRISNSTFNEDINYSDINLLSDEMIDGETEYVFHACGLAENEELVDDLRSIINKEGDLKATINTDRTYVNFIKDEFGVARKSMKVFYTFYPTAYRPPNIHLATQYEERYPEVEIDWLNVLEGMEPESLGELITYRYNVPVEWEVLFPEYDMPELNTEMDKMEWIMNQEELMEVVEKSGIPFHDFRWIVKQGNKQNGEFISIPFTRIYGKATVQCILIPVEQHHKMQYRA